MRLLFKERCRYAINKYVFRPGGIYLYLKCNDRMALGLNMKPELLLFPILDQSYYKAFRSCHHSIDLLHRQIPVQYIYVHSFQDL
jgi:hypothetical protein